MKRSLKSFLLPGKIFSFKEFYLIPMFIVLSFWTNAQFVNFVNNPGFEIALSTVTIDAFGAAKFWGPVDTNKYAYVLFSKMLGTAPNSPTGFQQPRTGNNFIVTQFFCSSCSFYNSRGYPRNRLKTKLEAGHTYCVKYHVVNTNNSPLGIDSYGVYFGNETLDTMNYCSHPLNYLVPQIQSNLGIITDTLNWIAISGTYTATGDEKYMVLGNFKSDVATNTLLINPTYLPTLVNDIYIDDVSCMDVDLPAYAGNDAFVPPGDSVYIGRENDVGIDEACTWYQMPGLNVAKINSAGMWVKPAGTTTYVVRQEICGNVKWDTVIVKESPLGITQHSTLNTNNLKIWPVPAKDEIQVQLDGYNGNAQLAIFNSLGILVRKEEIIFKEDKSQVRVSDLEVGSYYLETKLVKQGSVRNRFLIER